MIAQIFAKKQTRVNLKNGRNLFSLINQLLLGIYKQTTIHTIGERKLMFFNKLTY